VFVEALRDRGIEFSIGFQMNEEVRLAICELAESAWMEAMDKTWNRETSPVAELTEWFDLSGWPRGTRMIVRREFAAPGATFNLFDPLGFRHQVFICDTADPDIAYLEAASAVMPGWRSHSRRQGHRLRNLPFPAFENNACWVELVLMAQDLIAFTQGLVLDATWPRSNQAAALRAAARGGRITTTGRSTTLHSRASGHGHDSWPTPSRGCARWRSSPKPVSYHPRKAPEGPLCGPSRPRTIHPRHFQPRKKPIAATGVSHSGHG